MRVLYISAVVVVLDQVTKLLVKGFSLPVIGNHLGMQVGTTIPLLGNTLRLTYIENPGMAFGIDVGSQLFLTIFSFLASAGVLYYLYSIRYEASIVRVSLALIFGGAVGNLIDRIFYGVFFREAPLFYGRVVDFIDVNILHLSRFGIFNLADAAVTIGVVLLLVFHRAAENRAESLKAVGTSKNKTSDGMDERTDSAAAIGESKKSADVSRNQ